MEDRSHEDILFATVASDEEAHHTESVTFGDEMLDSTDIEESLLLYEQNDSFDTEISISSQDEDLFDVDCDSIDADDTNQPKTLPHKPPARDRLWVIARIETMLERVIDGLLEDSEALTVTLKTRSALSRRKVGTARETSGPIENPQPRTRNINFPGATPQEAWNFAVILRILELVHSNLINNTIMTKRDIYYRHPDLFKKQSVVDRYVDDLACTFDITRAQLNISAAAKGLVAGNFSIIREGDIKIHFLNDADGVIVPSIKDHNELDLLAVKWILVIEKEATFRSILSSPKWDLLGSTGLILTAKGYPDIASRVFLRRIADAIPHIPIYALVDWDPDGIAIMSTYKYGSRRLAHEKLVSSDAPGLGLSSMHWLGVQSHDISHFPGNDNRMETDTLSALQGLLKLTANDRIKAMRMLEWDLCEETSLEPRWRQELQKMLMLNIKAEMQILDELPRGLISWICDKLSIADKECCEASVVDTIPEDNMLF